MSWQAKPVIPGSPPTETDWRVMGQAAKGLTVTATGRVLAERAERRGLVSIDVRGKLSLTPAGRAAMERKE